MRPSGEDQSARPGDDGGELGPPSASESHQQQAHKGLLAGQAAGRQLMRGKSACDFAAAAEVFQEALRRCGLAALADTAAPPSVALQHGLREKGSTDGKAFWSASAGSTSDVALSTRLLLARALMCAADQDGVSTRFDAAIREAEGVAMSGRLELTSPLRHEALKLLAKLCGITGGPDRLSLGVECCRLLGEPAAGLFFRNPHEQP